METAQSLTVETVTGHQVDPLNPDPATISIHGIAWSLSRIPRFVGHTITEIPYNVAQHSIYVSELAEFILTAPPEACTEDGIAADILHRARSEIKDQDVACALLLALLHDGHEAYIGDIPSPIKRIPEIRTTLKDIERRLDLAIRSAVLPVECRCSIEFKAERELFLASAQSLVGYCDKLAQSIESYQFMPSRGKSWNLPHPSLTLLQRFVQPMTPLQSYRSFLERFEKLRARINT